MSITLKINMWYSAVVRTCDDEHFDIPWLNTGKLYDNNEWSTDTLFFALS